MSDMTQNGAKRAGGSRLAPRAGEWINRNKTVTFTYEGQQYTALEGDVISSALWAHGARMIGRSFKYHRPRGILSLANADINTMMQDGAEPGVRGDVTPVTEGRQLRAVNVFGSLKDDKGARMNMLSPFLPAGFYYKVFHNPKWMFPTWERVIRNLAGLGTLNTKAPRVKTPKRYGFADVLVIGGGASGLSAAISAARAGAKVLLADENVRVGGALTYNHGADPKVAETLKRLLDEARTLPNLEIRAGTLAAGYYADNWVPLVDDLKMTKVRAGAVIIAQGAYEQPAVFQYNDLPGVMLGSAAQRLVHRYAVKPANRVVVLAANSDGYRVAVDMMEAGVQVAAIADLRPDGERSTWHEKAVGLGIKVLPGYGVYEAVPTGDGQGVSAAVVAKVRGEGELDAGSSQTIACDGILMSVGYVPVLHLFYQATGKVKYQPSVHQFVPSEVPDGVFVCGRANGIYDLAQKLVDGQRAGLEAARRAGFESDVAIPSVRPETVSPSHPYPIFSHPKNKNFVDFDEDLILANFSQSAQEGFDNIELMKRFTTVGMGPSQGKHSNMNGVRILAKLINKPIDEVGTTTQRPFFHPIQTAILGGRGFHPERLTPIHPLHQQAGAVFMQAGNWLRPEYYAVAGKTREQCIKEEVAAVRGNVGMIDVGTLGKIEISGPDAVAFIERMYTFVYAKMKVGMTRYAIMCDEAGVLIDDGVVGRMSEDKFFVTTTTSGSAVVYRDMNRWALRWGMKVGIVNATGSTAGMNLAGPNSRKVLEKHCDADVSAEACPYLALRECRIGGVPARVMRVGFVGELGYEIHVPAEHAAYVWNLLMEAGKEYGIRPFGVEAQRVLRLEKGHIIVSQDTDGNTTPFEAACGWAVKLNKPFFVGQRTLKIAEQKKQKQMLVGFAFPKGYAGQVPKECHLVIDNGNIAGRVTSVVFSETLGHVVGMAMVAPELSEVGTRLNIRLTDRSMVQAEVVPVPFYDPEGDRQKL